MMFVFVCLREKYIMDLSKYSILLISKIPSTTINNNRNRYKLFSRVPALQLFRNCIKRKRYVIILLIMMNRIIIHYIVYRNAFHSRIRICAIIIAKKLIDFVSHFLFCNQSIKIPAQQIHETNKYYLFAIILFICLVSYTIHINIIRVIEMEFLHTIFSFAS